MFLSMLPGAAARVEGLRLPGCQTCVIKYLLLPVVSSHQFTVRRKKGFIDETWQPKVCPAVRVELLCRESAPRGLECHSRICTKVQIYNH